MWAVVLPFAYIVYRIYFWPTIRAFKRGHPDRWAILMVNLLPGPGIVGALVWSYWGDPREERHANRYPDPYDDGYRQDAKSIYDAARGDAIRDGGKHERSAEDFIIR
jgi:hypothetical protein